MKFKKDKVQQMISELEEILDDLQVILTSSPEVQEVAEQYLASAQNLVQYLNFRKKDHRKLQKKLGNMGMSRLARAESHIHASVYQNLLILVQMIGEKSESNNTASHPVSFKKSNQLLDQRTEDLLGLARNEVRRSRIMVTLPTEAAESSFLVEQMVKAGMDIARVNCAHDDPLIWSKMIENVKSIDPTVKIAMDLAGPKIRTGPVEEGYKVLKVAPFRNELGRVITPVTVTLTTQEYLEDFENALAISKEDLAGLELGKIYHFVDARGSNRKMRISQIDKELAQALLFDTSYLLKGTRLINESHSAEIVDILPLEQSVFLRKNDDLWLERGLEYSKLAVHDENGELLQSPRLAVSEDSIFDTVVEGESIFFDDGKIGGKIISNDSKRILVKVTEIKETGAKLKAFKGINLPESKLSFSGLTEKDKADLKFIVKRADIINVSFVNTADDIAELFALLKKLNAPKSIGIILKIETQSAYNNLTKILLRAMRQYPIGVMIARGDLAVETGWDHIGIVQKEVLAICSAAHVPVIWATQVLENLAKKGLPSRSEITDAVNALKADCVMLNKGPYITRAIELLDKILTQMESYQSRNAPYSPELERI